MLLNGGTFNGQTIISQESIDIMTGSYTKFEDHPFDYGFSLFVLIAPALDGVGSTKGIFGRSGYHNTHFWIDQERNLYGLFMTRARGFSSEIQNDFRRAVYGSINSEE